MKILGIDIGNGLATCCLLDHLPPDLRKFNIDGENFRQFRANAEGINGILALKPDIAIMEPTGTNYSKLWGTHLARQGIQVRLVDHSKLSAHRQTCQLPDKDDESDSLVLAHYGWVYHDDKGRFLQVRDEKTTNLRREILRLQHLNRCQSPIICRLRQDLAWQFPEISKRRIKRSGDRLPPMLLWLSGEAKSKRYDALYEKTVGLGLTSEVKYHAKRLCDIHREEIEIEYRCSDLIQNEQFHELRTVLTAFGFGHRQQAAICSQIYPLDDFLDSNGNPIIEITRGKNSKKPTRKYLSQRRFEKALGCAPSREQSGDSDKKQIVGGSGLCRQMIWLWIFTSCSVSKTRATNPVLELVYRWMKAPKRTAKPIRLLRQNTSSYAARLLFKTLIAFRCGEIPQLLHYEPDIKGNCSLCGDRLLSGQCLECEQLKQRLNTWFKSFS